MWIPSEPEKKPSLQPGGSAPGAAMTGIGRQTPFSSVPGTSVGSLLDRTISIGVENACNSSPLSDQ